MVFDNFSLHTSVGLCGKSLRFSDGKSVGFYCNDVHGFSCVLQ